MSTNNYKGNVGIKNDIKLSKTQTIAIGFLMIILIGATILSFPISSRSGEWTDFSTTLFTATSATCVTGLVVVDTYQHWSLFGQIVILILVEIGGLGFMTIGASFVMVFGKKISLKGRGILQESMSTLEIGGIVKLTKKIVVSTLIIEGIGAVLLSISFCQDMDIIEGIYYGIFHSVMAFCSAGFDLMGKYKPYSSFVNYIDNWFVILVISFLVVVGGLGFVVWDDLFKNKLNFKKYILQTKVVLTMSGILIFGGMIAFYFLERNNEYTLLNQSFSGKVLGSLFASITPRTSGFNTIDIGKMTTSGKMLTICLMFIGGSPGSTTGGIKTTTLFVIIMYLRANIKHTYTCNAFGRRFSDETIKKAIFVFSLNLMIAILAVLIICTVQGDLALEDVLFEVFSAIGTAGMTTGTTRELNTISRIVIMILMFFGRVGSLSIILSFTRNKKIAPVQQPVGKITVG